MSYKSVGTTNNFSVTLLGVEFCNPQSPESPQSIPLRYSDVSEFSQANGLVALPNSLKNVSIWASFMVKPYNNIPFSIRGIWPNDENSVCVSPKVFNQGISYDLNDCRINILNYTEMNLNVESFFGGLPPDLTNSFGFIQWETNINAIANGIEWEVIDASQYNACISNYPSFPWTPQFSSPGSGQNFVWADILYAATQFSKFENSVVAQMTNICQALASMAKIIQDLTFGGPSRFNLIYSPDTPNYTTASPKYEMPKHILFSCRDFIRLLNGYYGNGILVDCTDVATMVMLLSNSIGCKAQVIRISPSEPNATLILAQPYTVLGNEQFQCDGLMYHDFCVWPMEDDFGIYYYVFDPCFSFNENPSFNIELNNYIQYFNSGDVHAEVYSKDCTYSFL